MSLVIDNPERESLIVQRAATSGQTPEQVIASAIGPGAAGNHAGRLRGEEFFAAAKAMQQRIAALPVPVIDADFTQVSLYDENGLPA